MKTRSDDYKLGYANGFTSGRRHRAQELATWKAVFEQNEELKAAGRGLIAACSHDGEGPQRTMAAERMRRAIAP